MAKKVPMMIYVDPEVETQFTVKPFAAGLATKAAHGEMPEGTTGSATATYSSASGADADADADFS